MARLGCLWHELFPLICILHVIEVKVQPAMTFWSGHFFIQTRWTVCFDDFWALDSARPQKANNKKNCAILSLCLFICGMMHICFYWFVCKWLRWKSSQRRYTFLCIFSDPVNRWTVLHFQVTAFHFHMIKVSKFSTWPNGILIFLTWDFIGHINLNNWHQSCRLRQDEIWRCKYKSKKKVWGTHLHPSSPLVFWASQL